MEYRELPHGGEKISVLGLGMGYISGTTVLKLLPVSAIKSIRRCTSGQRMKTANTAGREIWQR